MAFQNSMPTWSVFFEPRPEFIEWCAATFDKSTCIDCGCGKGLLVSLLRHRGLDAFGLDICPPTDAFVDDVLAIDAPLFAYSAHMTAFVCRPCRGEWIHATIMRAVESGCPVVYVGKQSHYASDLEPLPYKIEHVMDGAGADGESVWLVTKNA
ncbi:MAG: hypothetical protein JSS66_06490 [Armatimonadetes bacterium]|nr:hypothetical protein [Armatimonadota bacterium]